MGEVEGEKKMKGVCKEAEISMAASTMFPGFRFSPTDEELILYYLKKKLDGFDKCVEVIPQLDICRYEPWDLPAKSVFNSDQEWFFFSPRGKKYPNGSQSKRATEIGYWKATGKERGVKSGSHVIGTKRTLVFHIGRAPKGERTEWMMHEYCMAGKSQDALVVCRLRRKSDYHHTIDGPNTQNHTLNNSLSMMGSSGTNSGCGLQPASPTELNKMAESSMKKSSSSHDSHSVEQMDSASQSDWKFKDEIVQPESSSHSKYQRMNEEEDLFAEILNDNIVQLDECPPTSTTVCSSVPTSTTTTVPVVPRTYRQPNHPNVLRSNASQGTANRRIRLRKLRQLSPRKEELLDQTDKNIIPSPDSEWFWRVSIFREPMRLHIVGNHLFVFMIVTVMLILLASYVSTNPALLFVPRKITPR